ncbi:hypothetical protein CBL_10004 [Carabus blaptoides fortunei]
MYHLEGRIQTNVIQLMVVNGEYMVTNMQSPRALPVIEIPKSGPLLASLTVNIPLAGTPVSSTSNSVGDRIISINGQCSLTVQEIRSLLELGIGAPSSASICGFSTINSAKSRSRPRLGNNNAVLKSFEVDNAQLYMFLQPDERTGYGLLVNTDGVGDQQQANIIITHLNHDSSAYR